MKFQQEKKNSTKIYGLLIWNELWTRIMTPKVMKVIVITFYHRKSRKLDLSIRKGYIPRESIQRGKMRITGNILFQISGFPRKFLRKLEIKFVKWKNRNLV